MNERSAIREALRNARTIAVIGCSPNPARPSHTIARYLIRSGYRVIPVNPGHRKILGLDCYRRLSEIPSDVPIDIVDVFRRSSAVADLADEAIARGVGFFFMQQGVEDAEAAGKLERAGIPVAMDRCIYVERERLARAGDLPGAAPDVQE